MPLPTRWFSNLEMARRYCDILSDILVLRQRGLLDDFTYNASKVATDDEITALSKIAEILAPLQEKAVSQKQAPS